MNAKRSHTERLALLRMELQRVGVAGFLVPRADEHLGEYVPPCAERLAWLTGFTGSAGIAAILDHRAAVFTDGRYILQLAAQCDARLFEHRHVTDDPPPRWLRANAPGARIGYDPKLISAEALSRYSDAGLHMVPLAENPLDAAWTDRPTAPRTPAVPHPLAQSGKPAVEKRATLAAALVETGQDAAVLTDPASIAWLLNIRGSDIDYTPFTLSFAILHGNSDVSLFIEPAKLGAETRAWLGNGVVVASPSALGETLQSLTGKTVRVDRAGSPVWFAQVLEAGGARVVDGPDPCALPKACKNATEQQGARAAHALDATALCRFLCWLDTKRTATTTETQAAAQLLAFRAALPGYRGESFPAISGAGPNGAVIHYRVTPDSDRVLGPNEVYLIDSGAQFAVGTTDVTRTVWTGPGEPSARLRRRVTRVLQGHIAIATAIFPEGVAGVHLDAFARRTLWADGLDYDHGTGHGVGSYLSVHEGPAGLSRNARPVPLGVGMILSDEPGFYEPGEYGIRLENLLMVQSHPFPNAKKPFLSFETLTLTPFDRRLLDPSLMSVAERTWLDEYHVRVLAEVGPSLVESECAWLDRACRSLE